MADAAGRKQKSKESFEEAFASLEKTIQDLEAGGLSLEESTRLYGEGIRLAKVCNELLNHAELRITHLQTSFEERRKGPVENGDTEEDHPE